MEISESDKSAYNSAVQFMFELSGIRRKLHEARWNNDIELRYSVLVSYYMALSSRMNQKINKKKQKLEEKKLTLQQEHDKYYKEATKEMSEYLLLKKRNVRVGLQIFIILDLWERKLRKTENALGLLVPDKSNPAFALGGSVY